MTGYSGPPEAPFPKPQTPNPNPKFSAETFRVSEGFACCTRRNPLTPWQPPMRILTQLLLAGEYAQFLPNLLKRTNVYVLRPWGWNFPNVMFTKLELTMWMDRWLGCSKYVNFWNPGIGREKHYSSTTLQWIGNNIRWWLRTGPLIVVLIQEE